jgi:hypothetical protein
VETILRITDISAAPTPTHSNRSARAQQGIVAQWLREQATPTAPRTIEAMAIEPIAVTPSQTPRAAAPTRTAAPCGEPLSRRSARIRSRSRSARVPA